MPRGIYKHKLHSEEIRKKMSESHKGKHLSKETKRRMGEAKRGKRNPNFGKHFSQETKDNWSKIRKGRPLSKEHRRNLVGKVNPNPHGRGKTGKRKDLNNQYFRSTYEANFARILNYLGIEWEYEPCRFKFDDCSWLIDFYLPQLDIWVEVKGWMREKDLKLIRKMYQEYPNENVKILDGDVYKELMDKLRKKILHWE